MNLAGRLARDLEHQDDLLVADLAGDEARLVELNAVATSGWYQETNPVVFLRDIAKILAP